jgi:Chaperone of endosialidase
MDKSRSVVRIVLPVLPALLLLLSGCAGSTKSFGSDAGASGGTSGTGGGNSTGGSGTGGSAPAGSGGAMAGTGGRAGGGNGGRGVGAGGTGGGCSDASCGTARLCCSDVCVNPANDPTNCGRCSMRCPSATPYCGGGTCQATPCQRDGGVCATGASCCGSTCCTGNQLCCDPQGPLSIQPACYSPTPDQPTCPLGCAPLCVSDRNLKRDIVPIEPAEILAKVRALPISTWGYIDQAPGVRHLGPMAQDFHAQFGLGDDDRTYNSVDAHGVALAAIQALDRMVKQQQDQIRVLERRNQSLSRRLRAIETGRAQADR